MLNTTVNKAVVAMLGGLTTLLGIIFGESAVSWLTPELTVALGSLLTTALVFFIPNKTEETPTE